MTIRGGGRLCAALWCLLPLTAHAGGIDLAERYPPAEDLKVYDLSSAKPWEFGADDIWLLREWHFHVGRELFIDCGRCTLGIGHNGDGAVWAVVLPIEQARARHIKTEVPEPVAHVWLRFNPYRLNELFEPGIVEGPGRKGDLPRIRTIAWLKFRSSLAADDRALIPASGTMVVDFDNTLGVRRYYQTVFEPATVHYRPEFASAAIPQMTELSEAQALELFERIAGVFDREYPKFILHAELDFAALRGRYAQQARACRSDIDVAVVCAQMLSELGDPLIGLKSKASPIPVHLPTPPLYANPVATEHVLGSLISEPSRVRWTLLPDGVGYLGLPDRLSQSAYRHVRRALEQIDSARVMIVDLRTCSQGAVEAAWRIASQFTDEPYTCALKTRRNGPGHADFTEPESLELNPASDRLYPDPLIVLIGPSCRGVGETLALMLRSRPRVVTLGSATAGAPGEAASVKVSEALECLLPVTLTYWPDGRLLDGHGVQPDVPVTAAAAAFSGQSDPVLSTALSAAQERLAESQPAGSAASSDN